LDGHCISVTFSIGTTLGRRYTKVRGKSRALWESHIGTRELLSWIGVRT